MTVKAEKETVTLKVDGTEVTVEKGQKVYEAATKAGVYLPGLCFDPKLTRFGGCRMCIVDVTARGRTRAKWACCEPASNGVEVTTDSDSIRKKRQVMMEFLLMHHPLDCPTCNASGDCGLQDAAYAVKQKHGRLPQKRRNEPLLIDNPVLERDFNKCILCGKCVIICDEVQGNGAIDFQKRGFDSEVGTPMRIPLECDFCGQCLEVCPTGSFQDHTEQYKGHDWEYDKTVTTCPFCAVGCSIVLNVKNGAIAKVRSDDHIGVNNGNLCSRGRFGHESSQAKGRIKTPQVKEDGGYKSVGWDEAVDLAAKKIAEVMKAHGPDSVAVIAGESLTNEDAFVLQEVMRGTIGSGQINTISNMVNPALNSGLFDEFGQDAPLTRYENVKDAGAFFFFGCDAEKENPVMANMVRMAMRDNKAPLYIANTRSVLFKPMEKEAVRYTYGSETPLIDAIIKAANGEKAANTAGVAEEQIAMIAEGLKSADSPVFFAGSEIHDHPSSVEIVRALTSLAKLTGGKVMLFREYCNSQGVNDMGISATHLPGYVKAEKAYDGDVLKSCCDDGKTKALIVVGSDPTVFAPDTEYAKVALSSVSFLLVTSSYQNGTAAMADIVLPSSTFAERDGSYTSNEGSVQAVRAAVDPIGESKPEWEILQKLGQALGSKESYDSVADITAKIGQNVPGYDGLTASELEWGAKFVDYPKKSGSDITFDPKPVKLTEDSEFPYLCLIGNSLYHLGSLSLKSKALTGIESKTWVEISPTDAEKVDIFDGDSVTVSSKAGAIEAVARVTDKSPEGVLFLPKNYEENPALRLVDRNQAVTRVKISKA